MYMYTVPNTILIATIYSIKPIPTIVQYTHTGTPLGPREPVVPLSPGGPISPGRPCTRQNHVPNQYKEKWRETKICMVASSSIS